MNINHEPQFDVEKVTQHYTQKDGVPVKYVCTTDLRASDVPVDVYYRETPHPEFGNKYFGLYYDHVREHMMICNADIIESEDFHFGCVSDGNVLHYSQSHHDYKSFDNGAMIDGGRQYTRHNPTAPLYIYKVIDGEFVVDSTIDLSYNKDSVKEFSDEF